MMITVKLAIGILLGAALSGCATARSTVSPITITETPYPTQTITYTPTKTNTHTPPPTPTYTFIPPTQTSVPPTATHTPMPATTIFPILSTLNPGPGVIANLGIYGTRLNDWAYDVLLLDDGGTLIAGQVNNTGPSHRINPGNARLVRTDAKGDVIWSKDYGGEVDSMFYSVIQAGKDAYLALGQIAASYTRQEDDFYLVKINREGEEIWSRTYGGRGMDVAKMVRQTSDGGYILVGDRADQSPTGNLYQSNIVLIKIDEEGNEIWTHTYGQKILYLAWAVAQTPDGGYVLTGWEAKTIPDRDVIVIKTNAIGELEWSRTWDLDPGDRDGGFDLILTSDGYIVVACIQSMDSGLRGAILIKVDLNGNEVWVKTFGDEDVGNEFWDVMEDTDGGYIVAGDTIPGQNAASGEDIRQGLIIKTNPDGEVLWQYIIAGDAYENIVLSSAVVLPDNEYIFVGSVTQSGEKYTDMLWLKLIVND